MKMGVSPFFFPRGIWPCEETEGFDTANDRSKLNKREDQIESLLTPAVEALGCALWGIEYQAHGQRSRLRVFIDRPEGVTVDDCERVSRGASDLLDIEDVIPGSYTLEVSSPGMDRTLFKAEHYQASVGEMVDVRLNFPMDGRKHIVGVLTGLDDGEVIVRPRPGEGPGDEEYVVPMENIHRARVVPQFE